MKKNHVSHHLHSSVTIQHKTTRKHNPTMGKYMNKKPNTTRDVTLTHDVSSLVGVRTRAKTLALRSFAPSTKPDSCYLQLRSRRLEKKIRTPVSKQGVVVCAEEESPKTKNKRFGSGLDAIEVLGSETEACFGENGLDLEITSGRSTSESTPCNLIMAADNITPPGPTTRQRSPSIANQNAQNALTNIPMAREIEEFFIQAEHSQQQLFIQKYNFDVVHDKPLSGHYEWVKVIP